MNSRENLLCLFTKCVFWDFLERVNATLWSFWSWRDDHNAFSSFSWQWNRSCRNIQKTEKVSTSVSLRLKNRTKHRVCFIHIYEFGSVPGFLLGFLVLPRRKPEFTEAKFRYPRFLGCNSRLSSQNSGTLEQTTEAEFWHILHPGIVCVNRIWSINCLKAK